MLEHLFDAVLITTRDLDEAGPRIVYANPAFTRLTGYSAAEVVGQTVHFLSGVRTDPATLVRLRACLVAGKDFEGEAFNYRKDGSEFLQEWRVSPIRDTHGAIVYWMSIHRDVSVKRRVVEAEMELATSALAVEATHRVSVSAASDPHVAELAATVAEQTARATRASACACLYSTVDGNGTTMHSSEVDFAGGAASVVHSVVAPIDIEAIFGHENILRDGAVLSARFPAPSPGADPRQARSLAVRVVSRDYGTVGAIVLRRDDVTEFTDKELQLAASIAAQAGVAIGNALLHNRAQRAETRLRRHARFANAITTSLGEGVVALDASCYVVFVNPAAEELLGCSLGDLIGTRAGDRVRLRVPEPSGSVDFDFSTVLSGDRVVRIDTSFYTRSDGKILTLSFTASPIVSQDTGPGVVVVFRDVSQQRRAEAALRESEARFRTMADNAPVLIWVSDATGRFSFVNKTLRDFLGHHASDESGWRDALRPQDASRFALELATAVESRSSFSGEYQLRHADGTYRWVLNTGVPRFAADGTFLGLVGSCVDISARKEIDDVVRRAERDWVTTVDAIRDLIVLEDETGRIRRCNEAVSTFFNREYRDLVGLDLAGLFFGTGPEARTAFESAFRVEHAELDLPNRLGRYEVSSFPLHDLHAAGGGWVHIVKDVTERRDQETALRRLNVAINQAAESIAIVDAGGIVRYVNPALESTTGFGGEDVLGRDIQRIAAGPIDRREFRALRRTILEGRVWNGSWAARAKEGTPYYVDATVSPVRGPHGEVVDYVVVFRDVTERKRYEAIAEAVNMMDNAGYIFSGIRHELGNPINSVKTALTVLKRNLDQYSTEAIESYVDRTLAEISRVEFLLRALKTFSMHETVRIEAVDIGPFVEKFCALAREDFASRGIQIECASDDDVGAALVDTRALHQVLLNIFANAADALEGRDAPTIRVSGARKYGRVVLRIADNGKGLTQAQSVNLFKPFHTSKVHGTGLGLVIIKRLVTKMHGTVKLDGRAGVGAEVTLVLEGAE